MKNYQFGVICVLLADIAQVNSIIFGIFIGVAVIFIQQDYQFWKDKK